MCPKVTVLMCVYNGEAFLSEAIDSIMQQTFRDYEFIIIDDGSIDNSAKIILDFNDKRIRYIKNEQNIGLTASLNIGILISRGEYIARFDADDISLPTRLEKQVNFLNENPEVGLLGTWYECFPESFTAKLPSSHEDIYAQLFYNNTLAHPSVMFRRSVLLNNNCTYNPKYLKAQDYELWSRLIVKTKVANIPEVLLKYRVHQSQISSLSSNEQLIFDTNVKIQLYNILIGSSNLVFSDSLVKLNNSDFKITSNEFYSVLTVFNLAYKTTKELSCINSRLFFTLHSELLKNAFYRTHKASFKLLILLLKSPYFWSSSKRSKATYIYKVIRDNIKIKK